MKKYYVDVYEYERGWGSKVDFTKEFTSLKRAENYVKKFNADNTSLVVPDWYMVAKLRS